MLEIKNVTKIYKSKGGVSTKALDDVSISFGETGLVFLLGKSGSGKSTLLNVCGGLDEPTEGEVIVKGKSSEDFTSSDFDSYRNTFVGFIFQEYNILDEFNVEDNIALALELQGKPKDREKIAALLKEVELDAYAKRKPNTLSGGQKQRIAIARALIKDPQIIMADEPTGALDSATGKQVFDTLKHLSETRLVIVVSHDREFAEIYGDRIVELKDGKIISDVTKTHVPPETLDENVTVIGGNTLSIKQGSRLTAGNIKKIQEFITNCDGDVIVSTGKKEISAFKTANRMSESGSTEKFEDTREDELGLKSYTKEDAKFIRSRLPARKAVKIGASGLKLKPLRLIFTIFLSFIAFTMFGLFSTLMVYDGDKVAVKSFMQSDSDYINVVKHYQSIVTYTYDDGKKSESIQENNVRFTEDELTKFKSDFGTESFGYYTVQGSLDNVSVKSSVNEEYYMPKILNLASVPANHRIVSNLVAGKYPAKTDELLISSYLVDVMKNSTVKAVTEKDGQLTVDTANKVTVNSAQDIVGKYVVFQLGNTPKFFKVTGVFESGAVPAKFDELKDKSSGGGNWMLSYQLGSYLAESQHLMAFVSSGFYEENKSAFDSMYENSNYEYTNYFDGMSDSMTVVCKYYNYENGEWTESDSESTAYVSKVKGYSHGEGLPVHFLGAANANKTSLSDKEIILSAGRINEGILYRPVMEYFMSEINAGKYDDDERLNLPENGDDASRNQVIYNFADTLYYNDFSNEVRKYVYGEYWDPDKGENVTLTEDERKAAMQNVFNVVTKLDPVSVTLRVGELNNFENFKVVGFFELDLSNNNDSRDGAYLAQSFIDENLETYNYNEQWTETTRYEKEAGQKYGGIFVPYDHTQSGIEKILAAVGVEKIAANDVYYGLQSSLYESIETVNDLVKTLSTVFLWVGVVFAVFSALLLFNFISMSISNKRKEIGILRAVGARGVDVFKIFFSEAGIIVGICTLLALIGAFLISGLINGILKAEVGLDVTLFVFGFASIGMMIGIAVAVALISTFLPVYFAARKKPVESIRAL